MQASFFKKENDSIEMNCLIIASISLEFKLLFTQDQCELFERQKWENVNSIVMEWKQYELMRFWPVYSDIQNDG